jgi:integrase/recombinase XerD
MKNTSEVVSVPSHKDFAAVLPRYFSEEVAGLAANTISAKRNDLKLFLRCFAEINGELLPVDQWLPADTRACVQYLTRDGYAAASVNRCLATLRSFAAWLREQHFIAIDPCRGVRDMELPTLAPKAIRDRSWHRLIKAADLTSMAPAKLYSQGNRNRAILAALNASGLRINELLSLKLEQFVAERRKFLQVHCKGQKVRDVLLTKEATGIIHEYVDHHRTPGAEGYLFTNRDGGRLSRNGVAYAFNRIAKQASVGLPDDEAIVLRPHLLRHRHAYQCRRAHGDVFAATRLGHASLKHLARYSVMTDAEEGQLLERMD